VFLKGNIRFHIDNIEVNNSKQNLSVFGASGLPWEPLDPESYFGKKITVFIELQADPTLFITAPGVILKERTQFSEKMAIHYFLTEKDKNIFKELQKKHGYYPSDYVRKYPRIPIANEIGTFPFHVIVNINESDNDEFAKTSMVLDIENISPNGLLLKSESNLTSAIEPGDRINLLIDPRGWFPLQIKAQGLVCRITEELDQKTENINRYFGVKFTHLDTTNKLTYLELLKDILKKLKIET